MSDEVQRRAPEQSTSSEVQRREPEQSTSDPVQRREPEVLGMLGDYKIIPMTWVGPVIPGGPDVTLTGKSAHVSICRS